MKIEREGVIIELTEDEVFKAYLEQQNKFDIQNIEENMGNYLDDNEYEIFSAYPDIVSFAASVLRKNEDNGCSYEFSLSDACDSAKKQFLEWIKSDELQYVKIVSPGVFALAEAREGDENAYVLCRGIIDTSEYLKTDGSFDNQSCSIIKSYYGTVDDFCNSYEDGFTRMQLFAEMLFETMPYYELDWKMVAQTHVEEELEKYLKED